MSTSNNSIAGLISAHYYQPALGAQNGAASQAGASGRIASTTQPQTTATPARVRADSVHLSATAQANALYQEGRTVSQIAYSLDVSADVVYGYLSLKPASTGAVSGGAGSAGTPISGAGSSTAAQSTGAQSSVAQSTASQPTAAQPTSAQPAAAQLGAAASATAASAGAQTGSAAPLFGSPPPLGTPAAGSPAAGSPALPTDNLSFLATKNSTPQVNAIA